MKRRNLILIVGTILILITLAVVVAVQINGDESTRGISADEELKDEVILIFVNTTTNETIGGYNLSRNE
jgi:hypothetical protein